MISALCTYIYSSVLGHFLKLKLLFYSHSWIQTANGDLRRRRCLIQATAAALLHFHDHLGCLRRFLDPQHLQKPPFSGHFITNFVLSFFLSLSLSQLCTIPRCFLVPLLARWGDYIINFSTLSLSLSFGCFFVYRSKISFISYINNVFGEYLLDFTKRVSLLPCVKALKMGFFFRYWLALSRILGISLMI